MQMATNDGRRMIEEAQQISQKFAQSLGTADREHVSSTYLRDKRALMKQAHDG